MILGRGYKAISWGHLEKGDPVSNLLISHDGERYRVELTVQVLGDINQRDLAERLSRADSLSRECESETQRPPKQRHKVGLNPKLESKTQNWVKKLNTSQGCSQRCSKTQSQGRKR
ncbi:unnamed protein product [Lepidochelys kempii]